MKESFVRKVRTFESIFEDASTPSPRGLTYVPRLNRFLVFNATPGRTGDVTALTLTEDRDTEQTDRFQTDITNPLNTAYDDEFGRILSLPDADRLLSARPGTNNRITAATTRRTNIEETADLRNPRGVTVAANGTTFVLDRTGQGAAIVELDPNRSGDFNNRPVSRIELPDRIQNPRGLAIDPTTGNFHVLTPADDLLYEVTPRGAIVAVRNLSELDLRNPQSLTFAPSGDLTDNPAEQSLYIADSAPDSGGIVEVSFDVPRTRQAQSQATLVRTIQTSQLSPPSSDPSGIVYINHTNSLLISDGEIDEIPALFTGKNLFDISLTGSLQRTFTTVPSSREPTGVGYNPANRFLFFSDDNADRIFQLNPGSDGQYNTGDDAWTSFSTRAFNSFDPEDVVFSTTTGDLFVLDGVNAEVYRVSTSGALISQFDTERWGITDPEGITFLDSGNLAIVGRPANRVAEMTTAGALVRTIDISAANPVKPAGLAFGPSSQNPTQRSLYVADRGVDNNVNPNQNDGKVYEFSLGTTATNQVPVTSAGPDQTIVLQAYLDGAVFDDGLPNPPSAVSTSWSQLSGPGSVSFANPNAQDTTATFSTPGNYVLQLAASDSVLTGTDTATIRVLDPQSTLFVSLSNNSSVGGVVYQNEDILAFDRLTNTWLMYFDGSDVGLSSLDVKDFHIAANGTILFTLNTAATLAGIGEVDDSDVIRFTPTATGETTAGSFSLYFDGSDVDLTTDGEALDGFAIAPDGRLIISTKGSATVGSIASADEDLLAFSVTSLGVNTVGTWALYFDGSDVSLAESSSEDVDSVWLDGTGKLYLSTEGDFSVPGLTGTGSDVVSFTPTTLGANTAGSYASFFTGSTAGLSGSIVDGVTQVF